MAYLDPSTAAPPANIAWSRSSEAGEPDLRPYSSLAPRPDCGVLLLHGLHGGPEEMGQLADALNRQGFVTRSPQLAGSASTAAHWRRRLDLAQAALMELCAATDLVFVAGFGAGAGLAVALAEASRQVHGLALHSMTYQLDGWNMPPWQARPGLVRVLGGLPILRDLAVGPAYPHGLKDLRPRASASAAGDASSRLRLSAIDDLRRLGRHVDRCAPSVTVPALILHALEDDVSAPRNATRIGASLAGPVEFAWLEDCYHRILLDRQHAEVAQRTGSFFDAIARASTRPARQG